jgi:hypothetical protein
MFLQTIIVLTRLRTLVIGKGSNHKFNMPKVITNRVEVVQGKVAEPLFIRLPKVGEYCPVSGLTRNVLNTLILPMQVNDFKPPVRSISLKRPGKKRGCRLVDYKSLLSYLSLF